jgi:O-antigen/teichoic acid export membrane protein
VFFANLPLPFQKIRTYLWVIVFSRMLGPSEFGIWSLFQTTMGITMILTSMTQGNAMMRFLGGDRTRDEINSVFSSVAMAVTISALVVALTLAGFANSLATPIFHDRLGRRVILLIALILPFENWFEQMRGLLRARRLNRTWAWFTLGRQMPEAVILLLLVLLWKSDVIGLIGGYLLSTILSVVAGLSYLLRYQGVRIVRPMIRVWTNYLPYGLALVPAGLVSTISFSADRYLVGYYLNLREVGIYSVCFTISALGFFFVGPLNDVLLPEIGALYDSGDWTEFYSRFSTVQKLVLGVAAGATSLLVAFPQQLLHLVSSSEFASGESTLIVLGLQGVFMSMVMLYIVVLCVRSRVWSTSMVWAAMGTLALGGDVLLLPRVGIVGAGISQLVSSIVGAILVISLNKDVFCHTFQWRWLGQCGVPILGVVLLAHLWHNSSHSTIRSLQQLLVGAAVFITGLLVTRYLRFTELLRLGHAALRLRTVRIANKA